MIQIKNKYNGVIIKEVEALRGSDLTNSDLSYSDLRGSDLSYSNLSYINLRGSDLRNSDLRGSDLTNSDLRNCDLRYVIGNGKEVKSLQIGTYIVSYYKNILNIGCQSHPLETWINFTDEEIYIMDKRFSLDWWRLNKDILITLVKREIKWYS
jgi:hypothetical protein